MATLELDAVHKSDMLHVLSFTFMYIFVCVCVCVCMYIWLRIWLFLRHNTKLNTSHQTPADQLAAVRLILPALICQWEPHFRCREWETVQDRMQRFPCFVAVNSLSILMKGTTSQWTHTHTDLLWHIVVGEWHCCGLRPPSCSVTIQHHTHLLKHRTNYSHHCCPGWQ